MSDQFGNFTERARKALLLAREEARRLNHSYIGTEHLLLGLAGVTNGVAARALAGLGLNLPRLREGVLFHVGPGEPPAGDDLAFAPRAKTAIELAIEEARLLNHLYVGTEHLLLGLVRRDERRAGPSVAMIVLESLGFVPAQVRQHVLEVLGAAPGAAVARPRDHVVTCRVDDRTLAALDALVETGVHATRSAAAARLIEAGITANQPLFEKVYGAVAEIRRVREETQTLARLWEEGGAGASADDPAPDDARRGQGQGEPEE